MNITHAMISNSCRGCILDNTFTEEQKKELYRILDKFDAVKISNIWKFTKYLKQFDDKYAAFGGNVKMLEERIQKIRDEQYISASKFVPGVKLIRHSEQVIK